MSGRDAFVSSREARWRRLELLLSRRRLRAAGDWSELAALYRVVCADLSTAQSLALSPDVHRYLDDLAGRAHNRLYGVRRGGGWWVVRLVAIEFPQELWRAWPFFVAAMLLFYGPYAIGLVGGLAFDGFAGSVVPEAMLDQMEAAYTGDATRRTGGEDAMMAGFYVWNNIGIAFRCFATGGLAGLGSVFYLIYNGLVLGTMEGHLFSVGGAYNLMTFTAGHTAWELTGIVVSGTAGLRLGWALVVTGGRTRVGSLRDAAPGLFRLMVGAFVMLAIAAAIEGFWSASPVPAPIKWLFGLFGVFAVVAWLAVGGWRAR